MSDFRPIARARIRWLKPEEGGRWTRPTIVPYVTTAQIANKEDSNTFSILLRWATSGAHEQFEHEAELDVLFVDEIEGMLKPKTVLSIFEGPHVVAVCEILEVFDLRK